MNIADKNGNTPLHLAVQHGCVEMVSALIDAGARVNARNLRQETPLMAAANMNCVDLARLLLVSGADAKARDIYGMNAAFHAISAMRFSDYDPNQEPIAKRRRLVFELLKDAGLDLNERNTLLGDTLLTYDMHLYGEQVERWADLLELGVDVNAPAGQGQTVLIRAARGGVPDENREKLLRFLISRGADVNIKDAYGMTALDHLVRERTERAKFPEWVRFIDASIQLLEEAGASRRGQ